LERFERERQTDRETERQRDRETERQRDRETERQRDRETERQCVCVRTHEREKKSVRGNERGILILSLEGKCRYLFVSEEGIERYNVKELQ
jgi:hypothetical protein